MAIVRPRLTDHFRIPLSQAQAPFAIPLLDEDLPLHVDPFLLWASSSQQENALHGALINSFNQIGDLYRGSSKSQARQVIIHLSECEEAGLGTSQTRTGKRIGEKAADEILGLFEQVPQYNRRGFRHFEEIQFFVEGIGSDRISDISCSLLKSFLIDYTLQQCHRFEIPIGNSLPFTMYDQKTGSLKCEYVALPENPETNAPLLFIPKMWLRKKPFIEADRYFAELLLRPEFKGKTRNEILDFNRNNYGGVEIYVKSREMARDQCKNDPLFSQIPISSAKGYMREIAKLNTGKDNKADLKYEEKAARLLTSALYPALDFADIQARTDSGTQIRDLIFYNTQTSPWLKEIWEKYKSYQLVFELKNVAAVEKEHINQVNRYLKEDFGSFGVIVSRKPFPRQIEKHVVDLWSGQRKCIICLDDADLEMICDIYESKQRDPMDVVKKKYLELTRKFPG